jgi:hypothetical protein
MHTAQRTNGRGAAGGHACGREAFDKTRSWQVGPEIAPPQVQSDGRAHLGGDVVGREAV